MKNHFKIAIFIAFSFLFVSCASLQDQNGITLAKQGSFAVGGVVIQSEGEFDPYEISFSKAQGGQSLHADHAVAYFQIPSQARKYPLVFLHGAGQSSRTWQSTPDGREGFDTLFLRKGFSVYLIDQPRRGNAGKASLSYSIQAVADEQMWFNIFRLGMYPSYFEGVQFSQDKEALNQFFRQATPNTAPFDANLISNSITSLFDKIGAGILITHSQGGGVGWLAAMQNPKIKAIVAYEPGSGFVFPRGLKVETLKTKTGTLSPVFVAKEDFLKLTRIPIIIYYGDNIPEKLHSNPAQDQWRVRLEMAREFVKAINELGGKAKLVHLPKIGIYGNTHFPFSDLNNIELADLMSEFLRENELD